MKTMTLTIAAVLALQVNVLFAGNDNAPAPVKNENSAINMALLAPVTPLEATFEDLTPVNELAGLVPVPPTEATFEDFSGEMVSLNDLAPAIPVVAEFEDSVEVIAFDNRSLSPNAPAEADFE
jgi:hypothetical protein